VSVWLQALKKLSWEIEQQATTMPGLKRDLHLLVCLLILY
jgi:hypothetical protein